MKERLQGKELVNSEGKQIFWNYFSILSGQLGSMALNIFILSITARVLQPAGYGILMLFLMVVSLISMLIINWPNAAILRFGKEEFLKTGKIAEVFWARMVILAVSLAVSIVLIFIFGDRITGYIGIGRNGLLILVPYILLNTVYEMIPYTMQATGNMKTYGFLPVFEKSATLFFLLLVFFKIIPASVMTILVCTMAGQVVMVAVAFSKIKPDLLRPVRFLAERARQILGYSWSLSIGAASTFIVRWIDIVIIKIFMPVSSVGLYSISYKGMTFISAMIMSTVGLTFPLITSLRTTERKDLIVRYLDELIPQGVLVWSVFLSFVISVSGLFIPLFLGESYRQSVTPFMILAVAIAFNSIACFYSGIVGSFDLIKESVLISIFLSIFNLLGDVLLIPRIGLNGAAITKVVSIAATNILYIPMINRQGSFGARKDRYSVNIWAMPALVTLIGCVFLKAWYLQIAVFAGVTVLFLVLARAAGVFKEKTSEIINFIEMPLMIKNAINKIIRVMAQGSVKAV